MTSPWRSMIFAVCIVTSYLSADDVPEHIRKDIEILQSGTSVEKGYATGRLARARATAAIPYLVALLDTTTDLEFTEYRGGAPSAGGTTTLGRLAALALADIGDAGVDALIVALRHKSPYVRTNARTVLAETGGERITNALLDLLKSEDPTFRLEAASAFIFHGDKRAGPALLSAALTDTDEKVRQTAANALEGSVSISMLDRLISAIADPNIGSVVAQAVGDLAKTNHEAFKRLTDLLGHNDPDIRGLAIIGLGRTEISRSRRHILAAVNDTDPNVQVIAVRTLCDCASYGTNTLLLDDIIPLLKHKDEVVVAAAAEGLENITSKSFGRDEARWRSWWNGERGWYVTERYKRLLVRSLPITVPVFVVLLAALIWVRSRMIQKTGRKHRGS